MLHWLRARRGLPAGHSYAKVQQFRHTGKRALQRFQPHGNRHPHSRRAKAAATLPVPHGTEQGRRTGSVSIFQGDGPSGQLPGSQAVGRKRHATLQNSQYQSTEQAVSRRQTGHPASPDGRHGQAQGFCKHLSCPAPPRRWHKARPQPCGDGMPQARSTQARTPGRPAGSSRR